MQKAISQLIILIFAFLAIWLGLSKLNLIGFFKITERASKIEKALGDFYIDMITKSDGEITDPEITGVLEEMKERICKNSSIDPEEIKLHVVKSSEVNAFALPDNHLVILTSLIKYCKNADELAGVMAHEIAHIENKHIMQKLSSEIGYAALSTMINTGKGGAEGLKILTSSAYDRKLEEQADVAAVEYLQNCGIDPTALSDFLYRMSSQESSIQKNLTIISSHPDTERRAEYILKKVGERKETYTGAMSDDLWQKLCQGL